MANPSASALERATRCTASVILPQYREPPSEHASRGTAIHAWLEKSIRPLDVPPEPPDSIAATVRGIDLNDIRNGGTVCGTEVAFAYDIVTGRVRRLEVVDRQYGEIAPSEIPGTLDLLLVSPDGTPHAIDYKTGNAQAIGAQNNLQLRFAALVARSLWPAAEQIKVSFAYIGHDGRIIWDTAILDEVDLDETRDALRAAFDRWQQARAVGKAKTTPGPHCRHCPSQRACPVYARDWDALATVDGERWLDNVRKMAENDEYAGEAWEYIKRHEELLEMAKQELKDRAKARPFALSNGTVVQARTQSRRVVSKQALPLLKERYGVSVGTASIAAIEQALGDKAPEVIAWLTAKGFIEIAETTVVKAGKAR